MSTFPVHRVGTLAVIAVAGEVDLLNGPVLQQELTALTQSRPSAIVVDMTQTGYCDSAGVATLVRTSKAAAAVQLPVRVAASAPVLRIMRLLGADRVVEVYPSLAEALGGEAPPPAAHAGAPPHR